MSPQPNDSEWHTITRTNRRRVMRRKCASRSALGNVVVVTEDLLDDAFAPRHFAALQQKLEMCRRILRRHDYFAHMMDTILPELDQVQEMVCFGIGKISQGYSMEQSSAPLYQLALLLELRDCLTKEREAAGNTALTCVPVSCYDPVLTAADVAFLQECCQVTVPTVNARARHVVSRPTLCYMPHCDLHLYENLLAANWGSNLGRVVLLGNSLATYVARAPLVKFDLRHSCLPKLLSYLRETPLSPSDVSLFGYAFSDTYLVRVDVAAMMQRESSGEDSLSSFCV